MRRLPSKPRTRSAVRTHLIVLVAGIGLTVSVLAGPPAVATPDEPTTDELAAVKAAVGRTGIDGIAWYTDRANGKVVVTADSTVSAAERRTIHGAARAHPDTLNLKRADGVFTLMLGPGDRIFGSDIWCSVGFNVRRSGVHFLLTAGHCGDKVSTWYTNRDRPRKVGPTVASSFPGNDYALVRYANTSLKTPGGFSAAKTSKGQKVTRDGAASGPYHGTVEAINVTVRYVGGVTMRGMIQADICVKPGDSGGPLYSRSRAHGITSGGSGSCPSNGTSFYQPIIEVLAAYNVRIY